MIPEVRARKLIWTSLNSLCPAKKQSAAGKGVIRGFPWVKPLPIIAGPLHRIELVYSTTVQVFSSEHKGRWISTESPRPGDQRGSKGFDRILNEGRMAG